MNTSGEARHLLANHCQLVTEDLDQAREVVGEVWERHRSQLVRGRAYDLRWHQADLPRMTFSYAKTGRELEVECGPISDSVRISIHLSGHVHHQINGMEAVSSAKKGVVHIPGQELKLRTAPFRLLLLSIDGGYMRDALKKRYDRDVGLETLTPTFSLTSSAGVALKKLSVWAAEQLDRNDSALATSPETAAAVQRTLVSLALDALSRPDAIETDRCADLDEIRVRRSEGWAEANYQGNVGVEEMAKAIGVSSRSLQVAFSRCRGYSPKVALHRCRLKAARAALLAARPETTVTDVATGAGFFHFGRFALYYRDAYGESPSATRNRVLSR